MMRVHLDADTGAVLDPGQVPAHLKHPSNHGRVVTLVPMQTILLPPGVPPAGTGADRTPPSAVGSNLSPLTRMPAGNTGDGPDPAVPGETAHSTASGSSPEAA